MNQQKIESLALDLTRTYPRSPRSLLGGFVILGRMLDKCRAVLNGSNGEYHFDCPLDNQFLGFTKITSDAFKEYVATGATDEEVAEWVIERTKDLSQFEIIQWNNRLRDIRISELPEANQVFLETYIPEHVPQHRPVYVWFDVYDLEEERL